jgi:hypothetical protein
MTNDELEAHRKAFYLANGRWPPRGKRALAQVLVQAWPSDTTPTPDFSVQTLEGTEWREDDRYPQWRLPTNSAAEFRRNRL